MLIPHEKQLTIMIKGENGSYTPWPVTGVMVEDVEKNVDGTNANGIRVSKPVGWKVQLDREVYSGEFEVGDYVTAGYVNRNMSRLECIRAGFHEVTKVVERSAPVRGYPYCQVVELS